MAQPRPPRADGPRRPASRVALALVVLGAAAAIWWLPLLLEGSSADRSGSQAVVGPRPDRPTRPPMSLPLPGDERPVPLVAQGLEDDVPAVVSSTAQAPSGSSPRVPVGGLVGRAVDVQGAPQEDALVVVGGMRQLGVIILPTGPSRVTRTDSDGRFHMDGLPITHDYMLSVQDGGLLEAAQHSIEVEAGSETDVGDVVLHAPGEVQGTVLGVTGAPLAGAWVEANRGLLAFVGDGLLRTLTDPQGRYRFAGLPPGVVTLQASAPGHAVAGRDDVVVVEDEVTLCNLRLEQELRIEGRVVDSLGAVPAGAVVHCARAEEGGVPVGLPPAKVDEVTGDFVLTGLAAGTYKVSATADGYGKSTRHNVQAGTTGELLVLQPQGGLDLSVAGPDGVAADSFVVMLRRRPLALNLLGTGHEANWSRLSIGPGARGRAWLAPLRRGAYELYATTADGGASAAVEAAVADGKTTVVPLLHVEAPRRLDGSVVDTDTGIGLPEVQVSCLIVGTSSRPADGRQWTDAQGAFSIAPVPAGALTLHAWTAGYVPLEEPVPDARTGPIRLALQRAGSVRVALSAEYLSTRAPPFDVVLEGAGGGWVLQLDPGESGCSFEGLPPGSYSLVIEDALDFDSTGPGDDRPEVADEARTVEVHAGRETLVSY